MVHARPHVLCNRQLAVADQPIRKKHAYAGSHAEQKADERRGYNRQQRQRAEIEPKMHTVNHRVMSALMPDGVPAATGMSAAVRNELKRADAAMATSIVLIKDKKVRAAACRLSSRAAV